MKFQVTRSILVDKDLDSVKILVEDFSHWNVWSPWTIAEPDCKIEVTGTPGEVGHTMSWDGKIIGAGTNKLTSNETDTLQYDLTFLTPYTSESKITFTFEKENNGTIVTWIMDGSMPFFMFFMISSMKAWIGMDFERGLKMLKELAEKGSIPAKTSNKGIVDLEGFSYVGIQKTVSMENIGTEMQSDFDRILKDVVENAGKTAQHWVSLYPKMDMKNGQMTYIAAVSDEDIAGVDLGEDYVRGTIDSGKALEISHDGSYEFLGNAWSMGMMYLRAKKLKQKGVPFEHYWNSPKETKPEDLKTSVYFPLKG